MNERKRTLLALPYLIWMTGFTIIPLALIFVFGLQDRSGAFTLENVLSIFERDHMKALILSLELSLLSTAICLVLAFPLALMTVFFVCVPSLASQTSVLILPAGAITIGLAYRMYRKGQKDQKGKSSV